MGLPTHSGAHPARPCPLSVLCDIVRTTRHLNPLGALVASLVLLASFTVLTARPAAAAGGPAARVHAFGLPAFADLAVANKPVAGITARPSGGGYWMVASDGGIFGYGGAGFFGSMGEKPINKPMVGMAASPTGAGYWTVASDGGVFAFGDTGFYGSMGRAPINKPMVGMAATPSGDGYWTVASDGGVFAFGDAGFFGSMGEKPINKPVVGMAASATGNGYWLVAADGGVFAFGDAPSVGAVPGTGANVGDVVGMARSSSGAGFMVAARNGRVWAFGDAVLRGSATLAANRAVVGVAVSGGGYWLADVDVPPPPPPPPPAVGPPLPGGSGDGRRIVYCNSCHRVWFVEANGAVVKSHLVSGRLATPRPGTYSVYSKSRYASSASPGVTMEYMTRFAFGRTLAIGFHSIPRKGGRPIQSEAQLGSFRSAGCIRQADGDALALWNFAPVGTKVVVTP